MNILHVQINIKSTDVYINTIVHISKLIVCKHVVSNLFDLIILCIPMFIIMKFLNFKFSQQ